jgi:putative ABC transport system ATP-binding protein
VIQIENLTKHFSLNGRSIPVLTDLSLSINPGDYISISGESGSGKSTLLSVVGLCDDFNSGKYSLMGENVATFDDRQASHARLNHFGFLFQAFYLISDVSALENIITPLKIAGKHAKKSEWQELIECGKQALDSVGLLTFADHFPAELSGGQLQRIAFARAMVMNPKILLADEPTGNLDSHNRDLVVGLIEKYLENGGSAIIVTHDNYVSRRAIRQITLTDQRLHE